MAKVTSSPLRTSAARPSVSTVSGRVRRASAGQTKRVEEADQRRGAERGGGAVEDEAVEHLGEQQQDGGVEQEHQSATPDRGQAHGCSASISPPAAACATRS